MYTDEIIERNLHPYYKGRMEDANLVKRMEDRSCGDEIEVFLKVIDGVIVDASWEGQGCAVARAAADLMMERIHGKTLAEAKKLSWEEETALDRVRMMPARIKCAELAWKALADLGE